jgi:hypothetical protein
VDAIFPGIPERLYLFWTAGYVFSFPVLHVAAESADLPVAVELDAVRRIKIDALNLSAQSLALG